MEYPRAVIQDRYFLTFIQVNDLPTYLKDKAEVIMYADDCALIISENDAQRLEVKINDVLKSIDQWFCANNFKMNLNKSSFMLIKKISNKTHVECKH